MCDWGTPSHSHSDQSIPNQVCHCSKPDGVGRDIPNKQGENCLQPTYENYPQFLFSLISYVWELCLEISFQNFCLESFNWTVLFGNFVWQTDRATSGSSQLELKNECLLVLTQLFDSFLKSWLRKILFTINVESLFQRWYPIRYSGWFAIKIQVDLNLL